MTKILADGGGEGTRDIEKAIHLEGLREHAEVLEVDNADTSSHDVEEEVVHANFGMIDGEIIRHRGGRCPFPRAVRKYLQERNGSIARHKSSQG